MQKNGFLVAIVIFMAASVATAVTMTIAPDRMPVVDGRRVFILGLYENPKDDAELQRVSEAGFNLVHCAEDAVVLDRLHAHNLWGWVNTGSRIDLSEDTENRQAQLAQMAANVAAHPALLVWEVPDEALWNCWYGPLCWRADEEPRQQRELIDALSDTVLAEKLRGQQAQIRALRGQGEYAEAERLADNIWMDLGMQPPRPGYGLSTAAAQAAAMCAGMTAGYSQLRQLDPAHPVWMNHAPRNQIAQLAAFANAADIVGCDIYPVPFSPLVGHSDLAERSPASVGAYTDRMQISAPGKPVWMVLQGFGWGDIQPERPDTERAQLRRPTLAESRFMAYDAVVHGARGILYWGTAYIEKDSQLWQDLLALARELSALQPFLSAPDANLSLSVEFAPTYGSVDRSVYVLAKAVEDKVWFLVVNEWIDPITYTIRGAESLNGVTYREMNTGRTVAVDTGALRLPIAAQSVHVLQPQ